MLAGDAAHNIHPWQARASNLGLADAQTLARVLHGRDYWRSVADMRLLRSYERERKAAMLPMSFGHRRAAAAVSAPRTCAANPAQLGMRGFETQRPSQNWIVRQAMGTH